MSTHILVKSMHNQYKRDLKRASKSVTKPINGVVVDRKAESRSKALKKGLYNVFMSLFVGFLFVVVWAGIISSIINLIQSFI